MSLIDEVTREFGRLPGVGPRTAIRFVYYLMKGKNEEARRLANSILALADRIRPCELCGDFSEAQLCRICSENARDRSMICVVEGAFDVHSIERSDRFRGLFHVLGGRLSPLDGVGPEELRIAPLLERIRKSDGGVQEVILATSPSVEGEATSVYLEGLLRPMGVKVTRLARGIPVGSDLEYLDGSTLAEAFAGRREM